MYVTSEVSEFCRRQKSFAFSDNLFIHFVKSFLRLLYFISTYFWIMYYFCWNSVIDLCLLSWFSRFSWIVGGNKCRLRIGDICRISMSFECLFWLRLFLTWNYDQTYSRRCSGKKWHWNLFTIATTTTANKHLLK